MANLPADLPEDWTQGQYISPNGTEVGLSEKHGYNYLMQQVNAAQTAINNITAEISGALEGVAQETTSQSILTDTQEIISTLGGGTEQSVTEMLQTLLTQPNTIKNIQSGEISLSSLPGQISLSGFTDITKMIYIIQGYNGSGDNYCSIYGVNLTTTALTIKSKYIAQQTLGSYQVIEMY